MIGIEGVHCYVINDSKRMRRLIDDLNSPNVCVIFDPVNLLNIDNYKNQDDIIREAFDMLGDRIGVIHLKDFRVENNKLQECIAGEGILNTDLLLALAKEKKPEIEIVFELVSDIEYPRVVKQYYNFRQNQMAMRRKLRHCISNLCGIYESIRYYFEIKCKLAKMHIYHEICCFSFNVKPVAKWLIFATKYDMLVILKYAGGKLMCTQKR